MNPDFKEKYSAILIPKREFIHDLRSAIDQGRGYAAGKIGVTAQYMMYYDIMISKYPHMQEKYEKKLEFMCLKQQGLFPVDKDFYLHFSRFYTEKVRTIDCLGLLEYPHPCLQQEIDILLFHQLENKFIRYIDQEPDKSIPNNDDNCYLHYFRGKKILLICPFAGFLEERATRETFENVWSKTGKKWFYPESVDSLEFPYGFSSRTHEIYPTVFDLLKDITDQIDKKSFDIALIAAAGLAIPIASHIKNSGKIALDLGGSLQILFGVWGKRWKELEGWQRDYFNEFWTEVPEKYRPKEKDVCDAGAYW